jgi:D-alanyl-D-alanine dipeptidase
MPEFGLISKVDTMTVLLADSQITSIPAHDNGDLLVDVASIGLAYDGLGAAGRHVRSGVAIRLRRAQDRLPDGVALLIREGHRSPAEQERLFGRYSRSLFGRSPDLDEVTLHRLASRFVSPLAVAPHVAGAAVDLTLVDARGVPLWMGTPIDATPEESADACAFAATNINAEARANRELLASVLEREGLVNYPTEWWHWSYGDRYWAYSTGVESAIYGPCDVTVAA